MQSLCYNGEDLGPDPNPEDLEDPEDAAVVAIHRPYASKVGGPSSVLGPIAGAFALKGSRHSRSVSPSANSPTRHRGYRCRASGLH